MGLNEPETRHYIDAEGNYAGAWVSTPESGQWPEGLTQIDAAPPHGLMKWNGSEWIETPEYVTSRIRAIEATITPRRIREAVLGGPDSEAAAWLAAKEAEIAALRENL